MLEFQTLGVSDGKVNIFSALKRLKVNIFQQFSKKSKKMTEKRKFLRNQFSIDENRLYLKISPLTITIKELKFWCIQAFFTNHWKGYPRLTNYLRSESYYKSFSLTKSRTWDLDRVRRGRCIKHIYEVAYHIFREYPLPLYSFFISPIKMNKKRIIVRKISFRSKNFRNSFNVIFHSLIFNKKSFIISRISSEKVISMYKSTSYYNQVLRRKYRFKDFLLNTCLNKLKKEIKEEKNDTLWYQISYKQFLKNKISLKVFLNKIQLICIKIFCTNTREYIYNIFNKYYYVSLPQFIALYDVMLTLPTKKYFNSNTAVRTLQSSPVTSAKQCHCLVHRSSSVVMDGRCEIRSMSKLSFGTVIPQAYRRLYFPALSFEIYSFVYDGHPP
ncbi:hypothetical protein AGLY_013773 [Aphis glycines]|uniref:Uncharacterized protein n=1 Tax=Aphis glycines TaxID=307491 RepID=A0A6G0T6C4_APHGL|nr:hypothetical protein AGLY_013773 [Aphis glycines]